MSAYDITEFLRTAYRPFAYCVPFKSPLNTAYQKGSVTLSVLCHEMFTWSSKCYARGGVIFCLFQVYWACTATFGSFFSSVSK